MGLIPIFEPDLNSILRMVSETASEAANNREFKI